MEMIESSTSYDVVNGNDFNIITLVSTGDGGVIYKADVPFIHNVGDVTNTFMGLFSGSFDITGIQNTAYGYGTLTSDTTGDRNTAYGYNALTSNTTGNRNTAIGIDSMTSNTTGSFNTSIGATSLSGNITGNSNIAIGDSSLFNNVGGFGNIAVGVLSLLGNINGSSNVSVGIESSTSLTSGNFNVSVGSSALRNLTTGNTNIAIGSDTGFNLTSGSNNIYIGTINTPTVESNTIRIGGTVHNNTFISGIFGNIVTAGTTVLVNSAGQLGTIPSARRYKEDISSINEDSSFILDINPIKFKYKEDSTNEIQYGFIAEDMPQQLVINNIEKEPETIKHHLLVPLLINEVQKMHKEIISLKEEIKSLR